MTEAGSYVEAETKREVKYAAAGLLLYLTACLALPPICLRLSPVPVAVFLLYGFALSPDGTSLAYSRGPRTRDAMLIRGFR